MLSIFKKQKAKSRKQDGQILVSLIIVVPALILMVGAYLVLNASNYRLSRQDQFHSMAQIAADSGADYAISQLNQDGSYSSSPETTLHSDSQIKTTFTESITTNSPTSKTITSIGKTYWPASSSTSAASVTIKLDLKAVTQSGFSIVSGEGGLFMSNSSKIVAGDVIVNGTISLQNSAQIGLSTNPVNVSVADQACPVPPDSTYPRVCNSGEAPQPISINNTAHIYGTVKANNQTDGSGMSNPGLVASSGVSPQALPTYDRAAQKAAVTTTISGSSASCSSGSQSWAANTKITGDVSISGSCKVTVNGNVWITGKFTVSNSAQLIVVDSLGSTIPNIMVDGEDGFNIKNAAVLTPNSSSTGFEIYTFWSTAACSPDCTSVTGVDLYNSRNKPTIIMQNNTNANKTIFYAYWSRVQINNTGDIGAIVGQSIELKNSGTITFGSSVPGTSITTWVANGYRRSF